MQLKRLVYYKILENIDSDKVLIVTGARQVGKTTVIKQIEKKLLSEKRQTSFITLEDPEYLKMLNKHPEEIFKLIPPLTDEILYLLINEIQYLINPTNFPLVNP